MNKLLALTIFSISMFVSVSAQAVNCDGVMIKNSSIEAVRIGSDTITLNDDQSFVTITYAGGKQAVCWFETSEALPDTDGNGISAIKERDPKTIASDHAKAQKFYDDLVKKLGKDFQ